MKKLHIILLLSPLFLSTTCNRIDRQLIQNTKIQTFLDGPEDRKYLQTLVNFEASLLAKKRVDSVQFIFTDPSEQIIGISSRAIQRSGATSHVALIKGFPLEKYYGEQAFRVLLKVKIFRKAKYIESETLLVAEYDLSAYQ